MTRPKRTRAVLMSLLVSLTIKGAMPARACSVSNREPRYEACVDTITGRLMLCDSAYPGENAFDFSFLAEGCCS